MDTMPQNFMLYTSNIDTPGFIGLLGTMLGKIERKYSNLLSGSTGKGGFSASAIRG